MGVIFKRGTRQASFYTLIIGLILGLTAFTLDFAPISGRMILRADMGIPFMAQAFILFREHELNVFGSMMGRHEDYEAAVEMIASNLPTPNVQVRDTVGAGDCDA
jgi:hypothetical protein